jgi:hypothetical protein
MQFLTADEVATLAGAMDPRYSALVLLGAYGGLRPVNSSGCVPSESTLCIAASTSPRS